MSLLLEQTVNGLVIGSVYALIALGFSLIFSILEVINFAHGSVLVMGTFIGLVAMRQAGFWVGLGAAAAASGLLGVLIEKAAIYPLRVRRAPAGAQFISTIGAGMMIDIAALVIFGPKTRPFPPALAGGPLALGPVQISRMEVVILAVSLGLMAALQLLIRRTRFGKAIRATVQNPAAAAMFGVDVDLVNTATFALGSALAAVAGVLMGAYYNVADLGTGFMAGMKGFVAAVFGGIGSIPGAVLGGLVLGVAEDIGATWLSAYRDAIAFIILIVILLIRPQGILGRPERQKV
ncbi:MAG TPA: branched-chain amino acid ABC transporter permease [Bacillota bacterium]|jgi:branched-chain amino acid transport system permease protein